MLSGHIAAGLALADHDQRSENFQLEFEQRHKSSARAAHRQEGLETGNVPKMAESRQERRVDCLRPNDLHGQGAVTPTFNSATEVLQLPPSNEAD